MKLSVGDVNFSIVVNLFLVLAESIIISFYRLCLVFVELLEVIRLSCLCLTIYNN